MKEVILRIQIRDFGGISLFASVDGIEEKIFWSVRTDKKMFVDATIEAKKWLVQVRERFECPKTVSRRQIRNNEVEGG